MNDYTKYLASRVTAGGLSRREFMGRAMAAGVTLTLADKLFTESAMVAIKSGMQTRTRYIPVFRKVPIRMVPTKPATPMTSRTSNWISPSAPTACFR